MCIYYTRWLWPSKGKPIQTRTVTLFGILLFSSLWYGREGVGSVASLLKHGAKDRVIELSFMLRIYDFHFSVPTFSDWRLFFIRMIYRILYYVSLYTLKFCFSLFLDWIYKMKAIYSLRKKKRINCRHTNVLMECILLAHTVWPEPE